MAWIRGGKTNKSLSKRIKITGGGKIMKRPPGQNHFNAKDTGSQGRHKKGFKRAPNELVNDVKHLIRMVQ